MKIYLPPKENVGFCNGVKDAIEKAENCTAERKFSYGNLVHNQEVIKRLTNKGITAISDLSALCEGDTLIIRAHGAPKSVFDYCQAHNVNIVDATCKFVKVIQKRAQDYYAKGYKIVLVGDANHPEIIGVNGWCCNSALIVSGEEGCDLSQYEKVLIMFQTTFDKQKADDFCAKLSTDSVKTLEIFNTICYTTLCRQNYANYISRLCDLSVIIGDKRSSNTNKLLQIAGKNCQKAILVETPQSAKNIKVTNYKKICIITGASTPRELMEEVLLQMVENAEDKKQVEVVENRGSEMFRQAVEKMPVAKYKVGRKAKVTVVQKDDEGIEVNLSNAKGDGFVPNEELAEENWQEVKDSLKIGDEIECSVISVDKRITLSKKVVDILYKDDALVEGIKAGNEFQLVMQKVVKGGLLSKLGSFTVFVPASQIREGYVKNLEQYVGKPLRLVALENGVDEAKRKIVASQKELVLKEKKEKDDRFWSEIAVDEIVRGKVLRFTAFGAFVSVDGFDCLAHLTDLSWFPIKDPTEVLEIGKTYDFLVLKADRDTKRVSLGLKQMQTPPWVKAAEEFPVGTVAKGKVARLTPYAAFVELAKGIDGFLHISNVSWEWLQDITQALSVGDEIDVEVVEFDLENKRITLSRKATMEKPAELPKRPAREQKDENEEN